MHCDNYAGTILITGATDGIGRALAEHYRECGQRVLLLGRKPLAALDDSLYDATTYCRADLRDADAAARVTAFLTAQGVARLDLLVHNAGVGYYGATAAQSAESIDELLDVNLRAPIRLTHALLPWVQRARGQITFISSVVSGLPGPEYAVYAATKAALEGFARNLRVESGREVRVQVIRPGATRTGMHAKMGLTQQEMAWEQFPPAWQTALRIARVIEQQKPAATIGLSNRLLHAAGVHGAGLLDPLLRWRQGNHAGPAGAKQPPHAVITGAADGIGRALAWRYARAGYSVTGIDVDARRAEETVAALRGSGATAAFILTDLSTDRGLVQALAALRERPPAAVFIHNAGINQVGRFAASDLARQEAVIDLNLRAPLQLTVGLLRDGLLAADGSLVFLSSLSKYVGYPGAAVYAASKDGLAAYGRSLRVALGARRNVLTVFPGPTRTAHARRYSPDNSREAARMPPETLALAIFRAVEKRQALLIPGAGNRLMAAVGHWLPGVTERLMRRVILQKLDAATPERMPGG